MAIQSAFIEQSVPEAANGSKRRWVKMLWQIAVLVLCALNSSSSLCGMLQNGKSPTGTPQEYTPACPEDIACNFGNCLASETVQLHLREYCNKNLNHLVILSQYQNNELKIALHDTHNDGEWATICLPGVRSDNLDYPAIKLSSKRRCPSCEYVLTDSTARVHVPDYVHRLRANNSQQTNAHVQRWECVYNVLFLSKLHTSQWEGSERCVLKQQYKGTL